MSSAEPQRVPVTRFEVMLGLMACLSLALIFVPHEWFSRRIEVNLNNQQALLFNDAWNGGNSVVAWINEDNTHWRCELGNAFQQAYCSMQLSLSDAQGNGIDLTGMEKMTIGLVYKGEGSHVRIYLRNRHPNYSLPNNDVTTKYNVVQVPTHSLKGDLHVGLADFSVADWWIVQNNIPLEHSRPEFNEVVYLEIQTGSGTFTGVHEFQLDKLVFEGVRFSDKVFYRGIIVVWSAVMFIILLFRVIRLNMALKRHREYQKGLESINGLLNLQNKQFEDLAKTDQLTGLLNRMGIRDALYSGLKNWNAQRRPFSLILVDIDHFKKINDTYGHDVGDEILKAVANLFKQNVRQSDYAARWGGEEFVLVCPDTTLAQAQHVAETMRKRLEQEDVHERIRITASFGVATLVDADLDLLFKSADEALYDAKYQGRNRVVCKTRTD